MIELTGTQNIAGLRHTISQMENCEDALVDILEVIDCPDNLRESMDTGGEVERKPKTEAKLKTPGIEKRRAKDIRKYPIMESRIFQRVKQRTGTCSCDQLRQIIQLMEGSKGKPNTVPRIDWRWKGGLVKWLDNREARAMEVIEENWDQLC